MILKSNGKNHAEQKMIKNNKMDWGSLLVIQLLFQKWILEKRKRRVVI